MKKKISLTDIADALGVSRTLVSMVLNGQGDLHGISKQTQDKVVSKAKELNYRPNAIARGLRTGKSNTIGLIVTDISNNFYAQIARRIEDKASQSGYHLMFCSSDENEDREEELILMLRNRQIDGLILATTFREPGILKELLKERFPFVLIDRYIPDFDASSVVVDNYNGSLQAVEHLIANGHRNIGLLTISPSHLSSLREREKGYEEALWKHGLNVSEQNIFEIPFDSIFKSVGEALQKMLHAPKPITAIYAINNSIAKACLEHLTEMKLQIPKDIALLSFDDIDVFKFCNPTVTAVAQPIQEIGDKAVDILLNMIKNEHDFVQQQIVLPTEMMLRKSVKR